MSEGDKSTIPDALRGALIDITLDPAGEVDRSGTEQEVFITSAARRFVDTMCHGRVYVGARPVGASAAVLDVTAAPPDDRLFDEVLCQGSRVSIARELVAPQERPVLAIALRRIPRRRLIAIWARGASPWLWVWDMFALGPTGR